MKTLLKSVTIALVVIFGAVNGFAQQTHKKSAPPINPNGPVIHFDTLTRNMGQLKNNNGTTRTFSFTNTGKAPLTIENEYTVCQGGDCSGVTVTYTKGNIAPGEKGLVTITISADYFKNKALLESSNVSPLPFYTDAYLQTNMGVGHDVTLSIKGKCAKN